ncbi:MAG: hypothetical protein NC314_02370 [Roseburia sp.]|nr:hypothetical protein [Roseburia sp.]MCM1241660.1 hypothetical protein [Roseburia sp.]
MSVEAGFIMPWVIFLFVFLIYGSFYLYDKCVLFQDAYAVCFRGSIQKEEEPADYINAHLTEQFGRKYFGTGSVEGSVRQLGQKVYVSGMCSVKAPFTNFLMMSGNEGWQIRTEAAAQIINPTKIIRKCRMAENMIQSK